MPSQQVYALRRNEVFSSLETSPDGLTSLQAKERLELYGNNVLTEPSRPSRRGRLIRFAAHPMALLLWVAGGLLIATGRPTLGLVVWLVVLINAGFSFWREYRASQALNTLQTHLPETTRVIRNGVDIRLPAAELVPGDLLVLEEGDRIPADARVVEEFGLRTNNAALTGEAVPARKSVDASIREDLTEIERPNLIFAGTSVYGGTCRAVVYATGMLTQFGRIANLTQAVEEEPSQIQKEIARLSRILSLIGLGIGLIVFLVAQTDVGMTLVEALTLAVGIIVAVVPEGLLPTVTLALAMGTQRLALKGVLVKKLSSLETLGTVSVICTDKSGTLTQNQMTVRQIYAGGNQYPVSGVGYEPLGQIGGTKGLMNGAVKDIRELLTAAMLCNNSRLVPPSSEHPLWSGLGDQTEVALIVLAKKGGLEEMDLLQGLPRIHELPFDARRKRMTTIHLKNNEQIAYVKGAPKEVLQLCSLVRVHGKTVPLDDSQRKAILNANDEYARQALRVLAMACRKLPPRQGAYTPEGVESELTFLGLVAMMDPPRPEVATAVKTFRSAGIRMVMITGDYGLTAESLARRIGMLEGQSARIVTGADLEGMGDAELADLLKQEVIFARMAPEHKMRLVRAYQAAGEVVGVVGDGVNDAPALRKADIGFAMGISGTDVAKEAADVILAGDNFGTAVNAIEEGRAVYDNLRKFITYIFASNVPEILPFLLTALFNIPLALTVIQILAIDLLTDILPALALGMEKPEPDIMQRPPRKRNRPIIDRSLIVRSYLWLGLIEAGLCYLGFFAVLSAEQNIYLNQPLFRIFLDPYITSVDPKLLSALAMTVFHAGVVSAQIGNAFACRSEKGNVRWLGLFSNPYLIGGIIIQLVLIVIMIYFEPIAREFNHVQLPLLFWGWLLLYAPLLYLMERTRKNISRALMRRKSEE